MNKIIFLIQSDDQKGLLAQITGYFYRKASTSSTVSSTPTCAQRSTTCVLSSI